MLLDPPGKKVQKSDLPLRTVEEIAHSEAVDNALERRTRRIREEAITKSTQFRSLAERIAFFVGLIFAVALFACALYLWVTGQSIQALGSFGASGGIGGANLMLLRSTRAE
jgi:uncharacterized membrane protein